MAKKQVLDLKPQGTESYTITVDGETHRHDPAIYRIGRYDAGHGETVREAALRMFDLYVKSNPDRYVTLSKVEMAYVPRHGINVYTEEEES